MEIYAQKPGLASGPYLVFQVREMLSDGRLSAEDMVWHEGMDAWQPLGAVESLQHLLPSSAAKPAEAHNPPPLPPMRSTEGVAQTLERLNHLAEARSLVKNRYGLAWRRFAARTVDMGLFTALLLLGCWAVGVLSPWRALLGLFTESWSLIAAALWVLAEALLLNSWGSTPGKYLMGLRVRTVDGQLLDMPAALRRSVGVWFHGIAAGLPLAKLIFQILSLRHFALSGSTRWDDWAESAIQARPRARILAILAAAGLIASFPFISAFALLRAPKAELPEALQELRQGMDDAMAEAAKSLKTEK